MSDKKYIVAITGASGSIYGIRLLKALLKEPCHLIAVISDGGFRVLEHETGLSSREDLAIHLQQNNMGNHPKAVLDILSERDYAASPASGSFVHEGMTIAPCSMKTLAATASGIADNLITRSADVCLKEKRPLILLPRETPLNLIHLENMTRLCRAGATIMPPCPSFYTFPQTLDALADTVVGRILDHLGVAHNLMPRWNRNTCSDVNKSRAPSEP